MLEVLIATAIIGTGILGVMTVVPISTYASYEGGHQSSATFLAEQKMEELRGARWQALPANDCLGLSAGNADVAPTSTTCTRTTPTACSAGPACAISPDETTIAGYRGYTRTVRVANCATLAGGCGGVVNATLRRVTVTVTYPPLTGIGVAPANTTKAVILTMNVAQR